MDDPGEQNDGASAQQLLFDLPATEPPREVRPWRPIEIGSWTADEKGLEDLLARHFDLLRRNRQLLTALENAGISDETSSVVRFREMEATLVLNYIALKCDQVPATELPELLAESQNAEQDLAELRREILIDATPTQRDRALAAEPRIRPSDAELYRGLAVVELQVAEETGQLATWELELGEEEGDAGFIGLGAVHALADAFMHQQRMDEERKPLPVRPRLTTLLKRLPVQWLDAICAHLDVERERLRRDRELAVAEALTAPGTIPNLVQQALDARERELLAYLSKNEGVAKASAVTRTFGGDEEDGWFWEEQPPTSTLGRLRVHGLVFVGDRNEKGRNHRTVVIPEELREAISACLEGP